jgi:hypothetical protein
MTVLGGSTAVDTLLLQRDGWVRTYDTGFSHVANLHALCVVLCYAVRCGAVLCCRKPAGAA